MEGRQNVYGGVEQPVEWPVQHLWITASAAHPIYCRHRQNTTQDFYSQPAEPALTPTGCRRIGGHQFSSTKEALRGCLHLPEQVRIRLTHGQRFPALF